MPPVAPEILLGRGTTSCAILIAARCGQSQFQELSRALSVCLQSAQPSPHRTRHDRGRSLRGARAHLVQTGAHPDALAAIGLHRHRISGSLARCCEQGRQHADRERPAGSRKPGLDDGDLQHLDVDGDGIFRLRHRHRDLRAEGATRARPHLDHASRQCHAPGDHLQPERLPGDPAGCHERHGPARARLETRLPHGYQSQATRRRERCQPSRSRVAARDHHPGCRQAGRSRPHHPIDQDGPGRQRNAPRERFDHREREDAHGAVGNEARLDR